MRLSDILFGHFWLLKIVYFKTKYFNLLFIFLFNPASRFRMPKTQPVCLRGQSTDAVGSTGRSMQLELGHHGISSSLPRQAGPATLVFAPWCLVHLCRRVMCICMEVRWCSGSLPLGTFVYVAYWVCRTLCKISTHMKPGARTWQ